MIHMYVCKPKPLYLWNVFDPRVCQLWQKIIDPKHTTRKFLVKQGNKINDHLCRFDTMQGFLLVLFVHEHMQMHYSPVV
jgi:hypothetical protein